jgi:ribosomal protein S12 methylthiotransferase accessory factor YcaO
LLGAETTGAATIAEGASRVSGASAGLGLREVVNVVGVVAVVAVVEVVEVVEVACVDGVGSEVGVEVAVERAVTCG